MKNGALEKLRGWPAQMLRPWGFVPFLSGSPRPKEASSRTDGLADKWSVEEMRSPSAGMNVAFMAFLIFLAICASLLAIGVTWRGGVW